MLNKLLTLVEHREPEPQTKGPFVPPHEQLNRLWFLRAIRSLVVDRATVVHRRDTSLLPGI